MKYLKEIIIVVIILICVSIFITMTYKNNEKTNNYVEVLIKNQHPLIIEKIKTNSEILCIEIIPGLEGYKYEDVILYLNLSTYIRNNNIYYDNKILIINKNMNLKINDIYFEDLKILSIDKIYNKKNSFEKIIVRVLFSNIDPWLSKSINIGDVMYKQDKESIVAKIIKKEMFPTKISGVTNDGRVYFIDDPVKKEVILDIEIITDKLKMGDKFYFETEIYNIVGKVINLNYGEI